MTDRELLEAAAKAAGVRHIEYTNDYDGKDGLVMCDEVGRHQNDWNPLNDDGDALRLAVKLDLLTYSDTYTYEPDEWRINPYAATRRAIVRAAAAMAKEKAE